MQIILDRRQLHRIPELELSLPKTMAYLKNSLENLGCQLFSPIPGSLCAFFDFGRENAIAFRADCDALPIAEQTGAQYASAHPGCMHACGHDGHMAIALELARRLSRKTALPHNVLLIFQPGEESPGGARLICKTGVLEQYRVKAIFALHLWPGLEKGVIAGRKNEMLTHSCEIMVDIFGKTSHIAKAGEGIDALAAGVAFYTRTRAMEAALPEGVFRILNFGVLNSGTALNAISGYTQLKGSLRAFQDDIFRRLYDGIFAIGKEVEQETGCRVEIRTNDGYPAVINPPALFEAVQQTIPVVQLDTPFMIAEDFSWYQRQLPGLFFFLGIGDAPALHAANFDFDEEILLKGADFFEKLADTFQ